jgi:4-hydroxybenzoate polyprenyltransferase
MSSIKPYLRVLRPHQWLKNGLVFLPMLAAHKFDQVTLASAVLAFIAFSLVASSVYVLNDLVDVEADRAHPRKRNRPFASGAIPTSQGPLLLLVPLLMGASVASQLGLEFIIALGGYYLATLAYSFFLKRRLVIDICLLAGLYTFRIIAGGAATGLPLSVWLLAFSVFLFLSLAAVKRQAELVDGIAQGNINAHGRGYTTDDLPIVANMAISSGYVSVLVLALYLNSPIVQQLYTQPYALWGICLILLYWISRIVMVTHRGGMHDDPIVFAVKDWVSRICFLLILVLALVGATL